MPIIENENCFYPWVHKRSVQSKDSHIQLGIRAIVVLLNKSLEKQHVGQVGGLNCEGLVLVAFTIVNGYDVEM